MKDSVTRIINSVSVKFIVIGILSLLLLIPVSMIRQLVLERQTRSEEAILEVSQKWGLAQTVTGPYLNVPLKERHLNEGKEEFFRRDLYLLPDDLKIDGMVSPEEKTRGIYRVIVYQGKLQLSGSIRVDESLREQISGMEVANNTLYLCLGMTDLRGIKDLTIRVGGELFEEMPGLPTDRIAGKGIHIPLPKETLDREVIPFTIQLDLDGSQKLFFVPLGKTTDVRLSSTWADPSLTGPSSRFLRKPKPEKRDSPPIGRSIT
ncbi:MAG: inner membrane CreD family protein [Bacteroidales bacterium]